MVIALHIIHVLVAQDTLEISARVLPIQQPVVLVFLLATQVMCAVDMVLALVLMFVPATLIGLTKNVILAHALEYLQMNPQFAVDMVRVQQLTLVVAQQDMAQLTAVK